MALLERTATGALGWIRTISHYGEEMIISHDVVDLPAALHDADSSSIGLTAR
jgi:hypothetical protein